MQSSLRPFRYELLICLSLGSNTRSHSSHIYQVSQLISILSVSVALVHFIFLCLPLNRCQYYIRSIIQYTVLLFIYQEYINMFGIIEHHPLHVLSWYYRQTTGHAYRSHFIKFTMLSLTMFIGMIVRSKSFESENHTYEYIIIYVARCPFCILLYFLYRVMCWSSVS